MAFDIIVYTLLAIALILGFRSGLLRSLATILGYVVATPFAIGVAPALSYWLAATYGMAPTFNGVVIAAVLLVSGIIMGALFRRLVADLTGEQIGIGDRLLGAILGGVRIGLVGVLVILIFDQVFPPGREPRFLQDSKTHPYFSAAGQAGLRKLPPDVADYLNRLRSLRSI
jgi:membrane protein required for colicin V production